MIQAKVKTQDNKKKIMTHSELIKEIVLIFGIFIALLIGAVIFFTYRNSHPSKKVTLMKESLVRRSKVPNVIIKATTAKAVDVSTGKVVRAARIFSSVNDKTIYLGLDLHAPKIGTRIDYVRYLNDRYVDHGSIEVTKNGTGYLIFSWTTINGYLGVRPDGKYKVSTYTDGILEKRVLYTVTHEKISSVEEDNQVSINDSDFLLAKILK